MSAHRFLCRRSSRFGFAVLALSAAVLLAGVQVSWSYHPFGRYNTAVTPNTYIPVNYDTSRLTNSRIVFYLSDQRPTMASGDSIEALVSQVNLAVATWDAVPTSRLRVGFGGYTNLTGQTVPANPMGIVGFSASLPPGAAAVGGPRFTIPPGTPEFFPIALSTVTLNADLTGQRTFSSGFLPVLVHEMGHSLGLKHSTANSVMFQTRLTSRARVLTEDDIAIMSLLYPVATFAASTGAISGRVTTGGQGVSVAAVSAYSDTAVIGAFTNPDGTYTIRGLPPGTYRLMVTPLMLGAVPASSADNPGDPADLIDSRTLTNQIVSINTNIDSGFVAAGGATTRDPAAASPFSVTAGQTTANANISVGGRGSLRLETNFTLSFPDPTGTSVPQVWVTRGSNGTGGAQGTGLLAAGLNIGFTNPGLTFTPGSIRSLGSGGSIFPDIIGYTVAATSTVPLGSHSVFYTAGSDMYISPGHVRVVATPPPRIASLSPTSGGAGTSVTINGSNFDSAALVYFDGMPATITSRSSTTLVVEAPRGASGRAASVFVANPDGQGSEFGRSSSEAGATFTYSSAAAPSVSISPNSARPGQTASINITGTNTNFRQSVTLVGFGSGDVVVNSVTVNSSTSLSASITVRSPAEALSVPVTVVTGQEIAYQPFALSLGESQAALVTISGELQEGTPGTQLPQPLVVEARSATGAPAAGVTVTFAAVFGGGSVSPGTAVTDSSGRASTRLTLGTSVGFNVVSATAPGFASTGFLEGAGTGSTSSIAYARAAGNNQTGSANSTLPTALVLLVATPAGTPMPGVPVVWRVTSGGGTITPAATVTDSNGRVSATWRLGPTVGRQTVTGAAMFYSGPDFEATATAAVAPNVPSNGVVNGAGFNSSVPGLSAGVIASIFGSNLSNAPTTGVQPGLRPGTTFLFTTANDTTVTFDGVPAPLFFVSPGQLNVQVPFEVAGRSSAQVVVNLAGVASSPVTVPLLSATPGLFTVCSCGTGAAVVLNQDNSLNTASNAAARGGVVQLFATGLGTVSPTPPTGQLAPSSAPLALSVEIPTVTIDGQSAAVEFSGLAPGFVGLWQVNVRVPNGSRTGQVSLSVRSGGQNSNAVTIFVR